MPNIGPLELILILIVALLVIGPGKLPEVGSALGKSIREFRKATTDVQEAVRIDLTAPTAPVGPPQQAHVVSAVAAPPVAAPAPPAVPVAQPVVAAAPAADAPGSASAAQSSAVVSEPGADQPA